MEKLLFQKRDLHTITVFLPFPWAGLAEHHGNLSIINTVGKFNIQQRINIFMTHGYYLCGLGQAQIAERLTERKGWVCELRKAPTIPLEYKEDERGALWDKYFEWMWVVKPQ